MATATAEVPTETQTLVHYEVQDGVAIFTLDDPPANTYTHEMMRDLDAAILRARFDPAVDVIVITGAGEKFFCAGANINMLQKADPTWKYYFCLHANETLLRLEHTPKLVIAALNGHTVGGGLEIAMAADLRIARRGAGKVGLPEVALGVLPGTGGTQRLTKLVGTSKAIQLMVEGGNFDFDEAERLGIVNTVLDAGSRGQHQALLPERRRAPAGAGPRAGARAAGAPVQLAGRQGGADRVRGEAPAAVHRQVATTPGGRGRDRRAPGAHGAVPPPPSAFGRPTWRPRSKPG
jgi:enoyl-CoA hydratase/carnithine racemase